MSKKVYRTLGIFKRNGPKKKFRFKNDLKSKVDMQIKRNKQREYNIIICHLYTLLCSELIVL